MLARHAADAAEPVLPGSAFAGFRFPPDVIVLAVRWYLRLVLPRRLRHGAAYGHGADARIPERPRNP